MTTEDPQSPLVRAALLLIQGRSIVTNYVHPPIPIRAFDWSAVTADYDGPGCPVGNGSTEQEAINNLLEQLE